MTRRRRRRRGLISREKTFHSTSVPERFIFKETVGLFSFPFLRACATWQTLFQGFSIWYKPCILLSLFLPPNTRRYRVYFHQDAASSGRPPLVIWRGVRDSSSSSSRHTSPRDVIIEPCSREIRPCSGGKIVFGMLLRDRSVVSSKKKERVEFFFYKFFAILFFFFFFLLRG